MDLPGLLQMFGGLLIVSGVQLQLSQLPQRRGRFGIELQHFFQGRRASSVRLSSDAIMAACSRFCSSILSLGSGNAFASKLRCGRIQAHCALWISASMCREDFLHGSASDGW